MAPIPQGSEADTPVFDTLIRPHRSLSRRHGLVIAVALAATAAMISGTLALFGAWPVLGFAGGEIALACALLLLHGRTSRSTERVVLTERAVRVVRTDGRGRVRALQLPSAWLRVLVEERRGTAPLLVLQRRQQRVEIGRALGAEQRRDVGRALADALAMLRAPRFDRPIDDEARAETIAPPGSSRL